MINAGIAIIETPRSGVTEKKALIGQLGYLQWSPEK